jgi:hypothetical protein
MIKHIIVTRCKFKNDELFLKYFEVMKKTYIPSINNQTDKNFSIALICNQKHFDTIIKEFNKKIKVIPFIDNQEDYEDYEFGKGVPIIQLTDSKKDYKNFVVENNITIQTRHDCDDIMMPNYIKHIHNLYDKNKEKYDDFILNFQPTKYDVITKQEFQHSRDYSKVCSMFSTLIQKKVKHGIMDVMHDHLSRLTKNIIYIPKTYVKLGIHNNNTLSKIKPDEKKI